MLRARKSKLRELRGRDEQKPFPVLTTIAFTKKCDLFYLYADIIIYWFRKSITIDARDKSVKYTFYCQK